MNRFPQYTSLFYSLCNLQYFSVIVCVCVFVLRRGPLRLGMAKVTQVDFPPRELVSYSKETQTPVTTQPKDGRSHTPPPTRQSKWTHPARGVYVVMTSVPFYSGRGKRGGGSGGGFDRSRVSERKRTSL